jgi:FkbM family methyltransferase
MTHRDLIIDVGMNKGEDTRFYLAKGFRVIAIEANPQACERVAARHAAEIEAGRLTIINAAIFERGGELTFYRNLDEPARSTLFSDLMQQWLAAGERYEEVRVPGMTFDEVLSIHGAPRYLKIDIEGADKVCLDAVARSPDKPDYLSFEVDFRTLGASLAVCEEGGGGAYQFVSQMSVPKQIAPQPAREGRHAVPDFEVGCTGLFGAELPGEWVTLSALRSQAAGIKAQYRASGAVKALAGLVGARRAAEQVVARVMPAAADWYDVHVRFGAAAS